MQTAKLLSGWYRLSGEYHFSNIRREGREWSVDLRVRETGELIDNGELCSTKAYAFEAAERMIRRRDELYIPFAEAA